MQAKLRSEAAVAFAEEWEREYGPFTDEEMARAAAALGLPE